MSSSEERLKQLESANGRLVRENRAAYAKMTRMREALNWYAQDRLYEDIKWQQDDLSQTLIELGFETTVEYDRGSLIEDCGSRAQKALDDSVETREDAQTQTPERLFVWLEAGESVGVCAVSRRCAWESSAATSLDNITEYRPNE